MKCNLKIKPLVLFVFTCFLVLTACKPNELNDQEEEANLALDTNLVSVKLFNQTVQVQQINENLVLEHDIILTDELINSSNNLTANKGVAIIGNRWQNNTIHYTLGGGLSSETTGLINMAINVWSSKTNLTFVQRTNQNDYVEFVSGSVCSSNIGKIGGRQVITLAPNCAYEMILHEIGHTIGFWHEMARRDRDNFITLFTDRIQPNFINQFQTYIERGNSGVEFTFLMDYNSIMMYGPFAFAIPGVGPTMVRNDGGSIPNVRSDISAGDISSVNQMYPSSSGSTSIITIQGNNGLFVSSENGTKPMNCNRGTPAGWEKFEVIQRPNGKIALKGGNGNYVSSENGNGPMQCNRPVVGAWEEFTLESQGGNVYALKSNGKYVSSENGNKPINCNRPTIGAWEVFTISGL